MRAQILAMTPEQLAISPGIGAFVTVFVLAVALVFLAFSMSKHLRRVDRHRIEAEMRAEFEAERAAAQEAEAESGATAENPDAHAAADEDSAAAAADPQE